MSETRLQIVTAEGERVAVDREVSAAVHIAWESWRASKSASTWARVIDMAYAYMDILERHGEGVDHVLRVLSVGTEIWSAEHPKAVGRVVFLHPNGGANIEFVTAPSETLPLGHRTTEFWPVSDQESLLLEPVA